MTVWRNCTSLLKQPSPKLVLENNQRSDFAPVPLRTRDARAYVLNIHSLPSTLHSGIQLLFSCGCCKAHVITGGWTGEKDPWSEDLDLIVLKVPRMDGEQLKNARRCGEL